MLLLIKVFVSIGFKSQSETTTICKVELNSVDQFITFKVLLKQVEQMAILLEQTNLMITLQP